MATWRASTRPPLPQPVTYSKNQVRTKMKAKKNATRAADFHLLREICSYMTGLGEERGHGPQGRVPAPGLDDQNWTLTGPLATSSSIWKYSRVLKPNMLAMMFEGKTCWRMLNFMTV